METNGGCPIILDIHVHVLVWYYIRHCAVMKGNPESYEFLIDKINIFYIVLSADIILREIYQFLLIKMIFFNLY